MSALLGQARGIRGGRRLARGARGAIGAARGRMRGGRRRRRGRGISAAGIRAARKLMNLLRDFATAVPRTKHIRPRRRRSFFRPRRGDPEDFVDSEDGED